MKIILPPKYIGTTGDDSPASGIWRYTWRMTGWHQIVLCAIAIAVAALNLAPIEIQRRMVDEALSARNHDLQIRLGIYYCILLACHQGAKFGMRL